MDVDVLFVHLYGFGLYHLILVHPSHSVVSFFTDVYANQLEGTIPSELAKLPNLKYLDVHDNNLVGTCR